MWIWIAGGLVIALFLIFLAVVDILLVAMFWCSRRDNGYEKG